MFGEPSKRSRQLRNEANLQPTPYRFIVALFTFQNGTELKLTRTKFRCIFISATDGLLSFKESKYIHFLASWVPKVIIYHRLIFRINKSLLPVTLNLATLHRKMLAIPGIAIPASWISISLNHDDFWLVSDESVFGYFREFFLQSICLLLLC